MKTINLISKVEIENTLQSVVNSITKYIEQKSDYDFFVNLACTFLVDEEFKKSLPANINVISCIENQTIDNLVNVLICNSIQDYTICFVLCDKNWEHKINKIISSMDEGIEVCKISYLNTPSNILIKFINLFKKIYWCFVNMFTNIDKNLSMTDVNFQGFTQKPIKIMKNLERELFAFRNTNSFMFYSQKNLVLKMHNKSQKVEHLLKKKITKDQIIALLIFLGGLLLITLSFPLLLKIYLNKSEIYKFVILNLIIFVSSFGFSFYVYFKEEVKKYLF